MKKLSLEESEKILRGDDASGVTLEEAVEILKGEGAKVEKKAKPIGPTSTFTKLNARIEEMDARIDELSEKDKKEQGGGGVSIEEAISLLGRR